jgi:hypothetical protein
MVIITILNNSEINDPIQLSQEMVLNSDENAGKVKEMAAY